MDSSNNEEGPPPSYDEAMATLSTDLLTIYLLEQIMEIMELILELLNV